MARLGTIGLFALGLAAGTLTAGCLFEPRDAEPPGGNTINYIPDSEPGAVLENLDKALAGLDASGYLQRLGPEFRYIPDSQTLSDYPGVDWENWNRAREEAFISAFINNVDAIESALTDEALFDDWSGSTAEWEMIYSLRVTTPGSTQPTPYRGRAFFKFEIVDTFWRLVEWRDVQGEADPGGGGTLPTSGALRGPGQVQSGGWPGAS